MEERADHPDLLLSLQSEKRRLSSTLLWLHVLHAGAVVVGLVVVLSLTWNRLVIRRLQILLRHIHSMERGTWTKDVAVQNDDEIGQLAHAFNRLGEQLSVTLNQSAGAERLAALALLGQRVVRRVCVALDQMYAVTAVLRLKGLSEDRSADPVVDSLKVIIRLLEQVPAEFEAEFSRQFQEHAALPTLETEPDHLAGAAADSRRHPSNGTASASRGYEATERRRGDGRQHERQTEPPGSPGTAW